MNRAGLYLGLICWLIGAVLGVFLCSELRGDEPVKIKKGRGEVVELREGIRYYVDRTYTLLELPDELRGYLIRTWNADKGQTIDGLVLHLSVGGDLYVLYDSRATSLPYWLDGFERSPSRVKVSDAIMKYFAVFERSVVSGDFILGGNFAEPAAGIGSMYCVVFKPANWERVPFNWQTEVDHWELRFVPVANRREDAVEVYSGREVTIKWEPPRDRLPPGSPLEEPRMPSDTTGHVEVINVFPSRVTGQAAAVVLLGLRPGPWALSIVCVDTLGLRSPGSEWVFLSVRRLKGRPSVPFKVVIVTE